MFKNEPYGLYKFGYVEDLDKITPQDLYEHYKNLISKAKIDIFLSGELKDNSILNIIKENEKIVDMGTGAGFPGIPISIMCSKNKITLVDSLNKRLIFLQEVIKQLELKNVETIHARAEDFGKNKIYREQFDVATSRAVANLSTLSEYLLPLVKIGGKCICMKASDIEQEVQDAKKAIDVLGGTIYQIEKFILPQSDIGRTIIMINKSKTTPNKYPRKAGMPSKEPIK